MIKILTVVTITIVSGVRGDSGPRDHALLLATEGAGAPVPESGHLHQKSRAGETRVCVLPCANPKDAHGD